MNKGKQIGNVLTILFIGVIFVGIVMVGTAVWWFASPVNSKSKDEIQVTIARGDSLDTVAKKLKENGLIHAKGAFKFLVVGSRLSRSIQAGEYVLSKTMSLNKIVQSLTHGTSDIKVIFIEGWRREEMADALQEQFGKRSLEFAKKEFLDATEGKEGYLFPDTYLIPTSMSPSEIAHLLSSTFEKKVGQDFRLALKAQDLTLEQAVILASLVEREARIAQDRPLVAGILIKRWKNDWPLQVDASVQYALGYQEQEKSWWKKSLSKKDLEVISPYNSYTRPGLPPTPICNPSLISIEAVINQQPSEYWFYLSDLDGNLHYAKDIKEHNLNVAKYLGK